MASDVEAATSVEALRTALNHNHPARPSPEVLVYPVQRIW